MGSEVARRFQAISFCYDLYAVGFYSTWIYFVSYIIAPNAKQCLFYCLHKLCSYIDLFCMHLLEKQQKFMHFFKLEIIMCRFCGIFSPEKQIACF